MIDFNNACVFKLSPCNIQDIAGEITQLLIQGEELLAAFKAHATMWFSLTNGSWR
ncbi:PH domain-containing protein [Arthrobacter sp. MYb227]|uniref:PH domain-containing protein n=1 Tax=Arthrobacter sp. MYb227 TaxID=1848601 RepID=UPI002158770C|nr:PH domain-containing protein [Arthrobacter sp. MYb227]